MRSAGACPWIAQAMASRAIPAATLILNANGALRSRKAIHSSAIVFLMPPTESAQCRTADKSVMLCVSLFPISGGRRLIDAQREAARRDERRRLAVRG